MGAAHPGLLGRQAEQTAIVAFLSGASERPRALLLEGEAGIGKTSLWRFGVESAAGLGFGVLSSSPGETDAALPYAVLGDLFRGLPDEALQPLAEPLRSALEVALLRVPARRDATEQLAVCAASLRVLRQLSREQPLLIAVDDIQWIDGPSARVLAFVLRRLEDDAITLFCAVRQASTVEVASPFREAYPRLPLERVRIGPLTLSEIDDMLLARLLRPLRPPELERVYTVSGGNPFFAIEIGRFLIEHPSSVKTGEPITLPQSLAQAIEGRLNQLSARTRALLIAMAALSRPEEEVLRRADPQFADGLQEALDASLVERRAGRLQFTHPMLASVIYAMAEPSTRRHWHGIFAALLHDPEERARHLALATTGPDAQVAAALEEAARLANVRGAPDAAASLAQKAAELTPVQLSGEAQRRQIAGAAYLLRAGDAPAARVLLDAVIASSPRAALPAEALRLMGNIMFASGDLPEAERFLTAALGRAADDARATVLIERDLIHALSQQGKLQSALEHSVRMTELARDIGDEQLSEVALRELALTHRHAGLATRDGRQFAIELAEGRQTVASEEQPGRLHPLMEWAVLLKWSDDFEHARQLLKRGLVVTEGRDESVRAPILFHLAEMECWSGDWLLSAVYAEECAKAVLHNEQRAYQRLPLIAQATLYCCRGELDAARSAAREGLEIAVSMGDEPYRRRALAVLGATELAAARPDLANAHFERMRARGTATGLHAPGIVRSEGDEVEALLALGRLDDARSVVARVAADQQRLGAPWQRVILARCRALLAAAEGDLDGAVKEFEAALQAHAALPMPLERARTLLGFASSLRRARQKRAARQRLEEALAIFRSLGAAAWIRLAESELSRVAPAPAGLSMLTPTEERVASLIASGRTNREAAAELFLSVKTIEANLSRVYEKLSVRSRSELAGRLKGGATSR